MKIKNLFILFFIFNSCSVMDIDRSNVAPGYSQAFTAIRAAIFGSEVNTISPELVKEIPYASMKVRIGKGPAGLMILESKNGDTTTWVSADGVYLVLRKGKIMQTSGLINNLTDLNSNSYFNSDSYLANIPEESYKSYLSYDVPLLRNLEVVSNYSKGITEGVKLLNSTKELTEFKERITSPIIGWKAENKYWHDKNFFVWKSEQQISPKVPKIYIEVTKKPSG